MNGRILRKQGFRGSILQLDQSIRDGMVRLGVEAQAVFAAQDEKLWNEAAGPDFLQKIVAGAVVLKRAGLQTDEFMVLWDDGAHLAFITCCALALVAARLDREVVKILRESMLPLAMCCPIEVKISALPPWAHLPPNLQANPDVQRQYRNFRPASNDRRDVSIADALILYGIFQQDDSVPFQATRSELKLATEGFRNAIHKLRQTGEK
jgi:hypothetical protein